MSGHVPSIGHQRHGAEDCAGDDLADHHGGSQRDDGSRFSLVTFMAVAQEDVGMPAFGHVE
jgi:hypothetical protein